MTTSRFPHINKSTDWPGLRTVDPFALQVSFDPYLWGPDVVIHLCKTRLDAEYRNVGGWATAAARDAWFDSKAEHEFRLESEFHVLPGTEIKLPIAFEVLNHYNQIFIDFPPTPTEDGSDTPTRYYYFISDVQYRSPSSTACVITVDEWSTHLFDVDLRYIDLERGHAPMAAVSASDFLSNPLDNSSYLTIPDEVFGDGDRLRYSAQAVMNAGPHWLVMAMSSDPEQSPGTYGNRDNWRVPTTNRYRVEGALSQAVFAIEPGDIGTMLSRIDERAPQLLPTIQAVFLIPKRLVTTGAEFRFMDVSCREIEPEQVVTDIVTLDEAKFGYPAQYRNIAKLYTMPYAWIELTDESGRVQRIAVEDTTGKLKVSTIASILFPFIGVDSYVVGIGSQGENPITWANLKSHTFRRYGDWTRSLRRWNVPTYAILQNPERTFEWVNYWQRQQAALANSQGYQLAIDNNNLNYSLRNSSLDRQSARLSQQQASDNEQLAMSTAASASMKDANVHKAQRDYEADTHLNNELNALTQQEFALSLSNADAMSANSVDQANVAAGLSVSYRDHVAASGMFSNIQAGTNLIGNIGMGVAKELSVDTQLLGHQDEVAVETAYNAFSDTISLFQTMENTEYANTAAEAGVQTASLQLSRAGLQAQQVHATYSMAMSNNARVALVSNAVAGDKVNSALELATRQLAIQTNLSRNSLAATQRYARAMLNDDIALARSQAASTKGMSDRSAMLRRDLANESLANAQRAARLGTPKVFAQPTGSVTNYTRPQVLMANIKTQDPGAIAAAGDYFLRYGYAFAGRQWTVTTLTPMRHFSYWSGEARLVADSVNEVTRAILLQAFRNGVFVWTDPDEIGSISIYDNN